MTNEYTRIIYIFKLIELVVVITELISINPSLIGLMIYRWILSITSSRSKIVCGIKRSVM